MLKKLLTSARDKVTNPIVSATRAATELQHSQHDLMIRADWTAAIREAKNPLARFGAKYFSQGDEDGITLEILKRLGIRDGTFVEIGVGDGLENNTLILLAGGWRGLWIGGQDLRFDHTLNPKRFRFVKEWVTRDNVVKLVDVKPMDVLGIDLDGNDYFIAEELLKSGIRPKLFILEYNAKFPPPIKWCIQYDAKHVWDATDYMGASIASLCDLLGDFSYSLVCCNAATGANAFFVRNQDMQLFPDVPKNIEDIFIECRFQVYHKFGHTPSPKTVEQMLRS
jgi:hypothetical protein